MKRIITSLLFLVLATMTFAISKPSLDGRAVVAEEGVLPKGLFAKTVGYLPGDSVSVTNPATGVTINVLVLGSLDPSSGVAIMLSPEAADKLFISPESNTQVKITKRTGLLDETAEGSAVLSADTSLDPDKNAEASIPGEIKNNLDSKISDLQKSIIAESKNQATTDNETLHQESLPLFPIEDESIDNILESTTSEQDITAIPALPVETEDEEIALVPEIIIAEDIPAQEIIPEEVLANEIAENEVVSEEVVSEEVTENEVALNEVAPDEAIAENIFEEEIPALPVETEDEEVALVPEIIVTEDIPAQEIIPEEALANEIAENEVVSEEVISEEVTENEVVLNEVVPDEAVEAVAENVFEEIIPSEPVKQEINGTPLFPEENNKELAELPTAEDLASRESFEEMIPSEPIKQEINGTPLFPEENNKELAELPTAEELAARESFEEAIPSEPAEQEQDLLEDNPYAAIQLTPVQENPPTTADTEINPTPLVPSSTEIAGIGLGAAQKREDYSVIGNTDENASATEIDEEKNISYDKYVVSSLSALEKGKYYVQIATMAKDENIKPILETYATKYPIVMVPLKSGTAYQIMIGPLTADEYGTIMAKFKAFGYKDAFLRKIR